MKVKKPEVITEPHPFVGLLRNVSEVKEHTPSTTPKDKPQAGVVYYVELVMDNGKTYRHSSFQKPYLENFKGFIDMELEGTVTPRGEFESIDFNNIGKEYTDRFPRMEVKTKPPQTKPLTADMYWRNREERDVMTNAAIEQQFYFTFAKDFCIPLGRMTDGNWEELMEKAAEKGLAFYNKYGRTAKQ